VYGRKLFIGHGLAPSRRRRAIFILAPKACFGDGSNVFFYPTFRYEPLRFNASLTIAAHLPETRARAGIVIAFAPVMAGIRFIRVVE